MISVVICDDQAMIRSGLRSLIEAEPDVTVVGEAGNGAEAVALIEREQPDVALMDVRMPEVDGITAMRSIIAARLGTRIVILTTFDLDEYVFEALRAGASGFLLKDSTADQLLEAIRAAAAGEALLGASVTRRVIDAFAQSGTASADHARALSEFTARELDILRRVATGATNAEIAESLVLSPATVKSHVRSMLMKAGLRDRVQLVILAYESGLVRSGGVATSRPPR